MLVSTIEPSTWSEAGGSGTVEYFPLSLALVISQTPDVHARIAEVLDALRRLQDVQVATEMRFIRVSAAMARRLKREFAVDCLDETATQTTFLKAGQMEKLLATVQSDRGTNVLQAPRVTLFNGQNAAIQSEESRCFTLQHDGKESRTKPKVEICTLGFRIGVQPVVAADWSSVRLRLQARLSNLAATGQQTFALPTPAAPNDGTARSGSASPAVEPPGIISMKLERTIAVPHGETAVLSGWKRSGVPKEQDGSSGEGRYLLLMVTPRLLLTSSEEAVPAPPVPSGATDDGVSAKQEQVRNLLARYQQACRERRFADAQRLAAEALKLNPGCLSESH